MNIYPGFFLWDEHAHQVSFIIYAGGLFETKDNTINLGQIVKELRVNGRISVNDGLRIDELLKNVFRISNGITIIRSNAFAHRSDTMTLNGAFKKAKISFDDLRNLMSVALQVINLCLVACDLCAIEFFPFALEDAKRVLAALSPDLLNYWRIAPVPANCQRKCWDCGLVLRSFCQGIDHTQSRRFWTVDAQ